MKCRARRHFSAKYSRSFEYLYSIHTALRKKNLHKGTQLFRSWHKGEKQLYKSNFLCSSSVANHGTHTIWVPSHGGVQNVIMVLPYYVVVKKSIYKPTTTQRWDKAAAKPYYLVYLMLWVVINHETRLSAASVANSQKIVLFYEIFFSAVVQDTK